MKLDVQNDDEHTDFGSVKKDVKRKTTPMDGVMPMVLESSAIEPIAPDDLSGWE